MNDKEFEITRWFADLCEEACIKYDALSFFNFSLENNLFINHIDKPLEYIENRYDFTNVKAATNRQLEYIHVLKEDTYFTGYVLMYIYFNKNLSCKWMLENLDINRILNTADVLHTLSIEKAVDNILDCYVMG